MVEIKELPVWARILIGDPTSAARNTRNAGRESDVCREVAEILAEFDRALFEEPRARMLKSKRRRGASLTLCGEV